MIVLLEGSAGLKQANRLNVTSDLEIYYQRIELELRENLKYLIPAGSVLITDIKDAKGNPIPYNYFIKKNGKYYGADKWVSVLNLK